MVNTFLIYFLILIMTCISFASSSSGENIWSLSVKAEYAKPADKMRKSILRFENKTGDIIEYVPDKIPWGSYKTEEKVFDGKRLFLTHWAYGAKTVYYRIFNPNTPNLLVCEFITESEIPKTRSLKGKIEFLEIKTTKTGVSEQWHTCIEPVIDPKLVSIKRSKKAVR